MRRAGAARTIAVYPTKEATMTTATQRHVDRRAFDAVERRNGVPKPPKPRPPAPRRPQRHIPGFHPEAMPS
jgi:hypothetical protein